MITDMGNCLVNLDKVIFVLKNYLEDKKLYCLRFYFTTEHYLENTYPDEALRDFFFFKVMRDLHGKDSVGYTNPNGIGGEQSRALDQEQQAAQAAAVPDPSAL